MLIQRDKQPLSYTSCQGVQPQAQRSDVCQGHGLSISPLDRFGDLEGEAGAVPLQAQTGAFLRVEDEGQEVREGLASPGLKPAGLKSYNPGGCLTGGGRKRISDI